MALAACGGIVAILTVVFIVWRTGNSRAVQREEAALVQRGEPLDLADLARMEPDIPESENAAEALWALWETEDPAFWQAYRAGDHPMPKRRRHSVLETLDPFRASLIWDEETKRAAEGLLRERAAHLEAVRSALLRPKSRIPLRWMEGHAMLLPHLAWLQDEVILFHLETLSALDRGDSPAALAALENMGRVGRTLASEPVLICQWVRFKWGSLLMDDLARLMTRTSLTPAQWTQVEVLLRGLDQREALVPTLQGERVMALSYFRLPLASVAARIDQNASDGADPAGSSEKTLKGMQLLKAFGIADADRRYLLETLSEVVRLAKQGTPASVRRIEVTFETADREMKQLRARMFSRLLLTPLSGAATRFSEFEARRRAALAAVAIERFRDAHSGRLPEALSEVPADPGDLRIDPLDGAPLRYRKLPAGYVIYSVGRNRVDEGGLEEPGKKSTRNRDIGFIVGR